MSEPKNQELPPLDDEVGFDWEDRAMAYIRVYQKSHPALDVMQAACVLLCIDVVSQREDQLLAALARIEELEGIAQTSENRGEALILWETKANEYLSQLRAVSEARNQYFSDGRVDELLSRIRAIAAQVR